MTSPMDPGPFTAEQAELLLAGGGADSPLGEVLTRLSGLAVSPGPAFGTAVVAKMSAAAAGGAPSALSAWWLLRPRAWWMSKFFIAAVAAGTGVGGLAATGRLPTPTNDRDSAPAITATTLTTSAPTTIPTTMNATTGTIPSQTTTTTTTTTTPTMPTTTTAAVPTSGGPGRCTELDANIIDASVTVERTSSDPTNAEALLTFVAQTTGVVDEVTAMLGDGDSEVLTETAPGVWNGSRQESGGKFRDGSFFTFTALGCGFDELDGNIQRIGAP